MEYWSSVAFQDLEKKFLEVVAENKQILAENKQMFAKLETLELSNNNLQKTAEEYRKKAEELSAENEVCGFICYTLNWTFQTLKLMAKDGKKLMAKEENAFQVAERSDENQARIQLLRLLNWNC